MTGRTVGKPLREAVGWLLFPAVPVVLSTLYTSALNLSGSSHGVADPTAWDVPFAFLMIGPLTGYGFLAGSTLDAPDDPDGRRRWRSRRAVWIAVGPWVGFLVVVGLGFAVHGVSWLLRRLLTDAAWERLPRVLPSFGSSGPFDEVLIWTLLAVLALGWLPVAVASVRRVRRQGGRWRRAILRGLATAVAFLGSLFGTFWAATAAWRAYFTDPTIVPGILLAASLCLLSGCAQTYTAGEVRRRELFQALLPAWIVGLAILWRWLARSRGPKV